MVEILMMFLKATMNPMNRRGQQEPGRRAEQTVEDPSDQRTAGRTADQFREHPVAETIAFVRGAHRPAQS